jgi:DNA-binding MarR family transcriptional regulator
MSIPEEKRQGEIDLGASPGETWELLFRLSGLMRAHFDEICAEFGLSAAQGRALLELEPGCPRPMRRLAERLGNDASNVTGIADRLEGRGLVERRPSEVDRRVKALAVTREGKTLRERFVTRLKEAPSPITRLAPEDRRALRDILRSVVGDG